MKNRSFEVLCHKEIRNARIGSKEKSAMKHSWWQSCQPLLEYFLKSNLCMLYVVSKLRKLKIQCFKRCIIRSWNEGVQPLQSDHSKLKEEFCTALRNHHFVARWFRSLFVQCCGFPPEVSRHDGSRIPQAERPLRSVAKSAVYYKVISQPFLCICEISQTSFAPAKWSLVLPDIYDRHLEIFFIRFLMSKSPFSPCNPPIIGFLSYEVWKRGE